MHRGPVAWQFPTKLHTDAMIGLDVDSQLDNNTLVQIGRERSRNASAVSSSALTFE